MRQTHEDQSDDDDWEDDVDDDPDDGYVPCPHCGETMLEVADHCPACNRWITSEDLPDKTHPRWIIVVVLILIATLVLSVLPF